MKRGFALLLCFASPGAADPLYRSARAKQLSITDGTLKPGATVVFSEAEVNRWAEIHVPQWVPQGLTQHKVKILAGAATGTAQVDFLAMQHARGVRMNSLFERLIRGERPLALAIRLESAGGFATVHLTRLEISGVAATGAVLDFLVDNFFLTLFPEAKINRPFALDYDIEKVALLPGRVAVTRKK
jgi:hypothetical protein